MASLENLSAAHATLLVGILLELFVALGWLLVAALLSPARRAAVQWAGFAFLQGLAFVVCLNMGRWPDIHGHAVSNLLLVAALLLQVRGPWVYWDRWHGCSFRSACPWPWRPWCCTSSSAN